jgi:hypothetical protein
MVKQKCVLFTDAGRLKNYTTSVVDELSMFMEHWRNNDRRNPKYTDRKPFQFRCDHQDRPGIDPELPQSHAVG